MFFLQMSGFPGAGKSTLARQIAKKTNAVIVDHDIIKSALLESLGEIDLDLKVAGKISYNIDWSLVEFYLSQGHSVILDSPCLYKEMLQKGTNLSEKYNAKYKYVECYLNDFHEINNRLQNRDQMISQIKEVSSEKIFKMAVDSSEKPSDLKILVVNSGKAIESYSDEVLNYLNE